MKLRCVNNSIRLRLRKSDIQQLRDEGMVTESVAFGGNTVLFFSLKIEANLEEVKAFFEDQHIQIALPQEKATVWMDSNQVGIEILQDLEREEKLHLLIEKDFPCLDREEENKGDTFWELAPDEPDNC